MKSVKEVRKELGDTKERLYDTLDGQLANIKTTKKELEEFKEALKKRGVSNADIKYELLQYPINKKLQFVLNEANIHKQLDEAIEFLDFCLLRGDDNENTKGYKT